MVLETPSLSPSPHPFSHVFCLYACFLYYLLLDTGCLTGLVNPGAHKNQLVTPVEPCLWRSLTDNDKGGGDKATDLILRGPGYTWDKYESLYPSLLCIRIDQQTHILSTLLWCAMLCCDEMTIC